MDHPPGACVTYQLKKSILLFYLLHQTLQNKHCQPLFNYYWEVFIVTMVADHYMDAILIVDV